jgi:hypothetical protein
MAVFLYENGEGIVRWLSANFCTGSIRDYLKIVSPNVLNQLDKNIEQEIIDKGGRLFSVDAPDCKIMFTASIITVEEGQYPRNL